MTTADRIYEYLLERYPAELRTPTLRAWFDWYWRDGRVFAVQRAGAIVAAALARRTTVAGKAEPPQYGHDDTAPTLWFAFAACDGGPEAWSALIDLFSLRWPDPARSIGFTRGKTGKVYLGPASKTFSLMRHG